MRFHIALCLLVISPVSTARRDDYVDPNDVLNFDPVNIRMKNIEQGKKELHESVEHKHEKVVNKKDEKESNGQCAQIELIVNTQAALFQQYAMRLVHLLETKMSSVGQTADVCLRIQLSYDNLLKLRSYGKGEYADFHHVHEILTNMLYSVFDVPKQENSVMYSLEQKLGLSFPVLSMMVAVLLVCYLLLRILSRIRITWGFLRTLMIAIFFISVGFTWFEMYQNVIADQEKLLMEKLDEKCLHLGDASWWSRFANYVTSLFTFQDENCREYVRAMFVNPVFKVSPVEAVATSVVKTVVAPLGIVGKGIREFLVSLNKDLPMQHSFYVAVVLTFFALIFPFLLGGYSFRIPWLMVIEPRDSRQALHFDRDRLYPTAVQTASNAPEMLMRQGPPESIQPVSYAAHNQLMQGRPSHVSEECADNTSMHLQVQQSFQQHTTSCESSLSTVMPPQEKSFSGPVSDSTSGLGILPKDKMTISDKPGACSPVPSAVRVSESQLVSSQQTPKHFNEGSGENIMRTGDSTAEGNTVVTDDISNLDCLAGGDALLSHNSKERKGVERCKQETDISAASREVERTEKLDTDVATDLSFDSDIPPHQRNNLEQPRHE